MKISKINRRDDAAIVNKQIGPFFVKKYVYSKNQARHFECQCKCGALKILSKGQINFGHLKSCGCSKAYKDFRDVFQNNVKEANGCLIWTGTTTPEGYGRFQFRRKVYTAHRVYWEMKRGKIPDGLKIGHKCGNRACVKIEHLYLVQPGKPKDIPIVTRGSKNGSAKLDEERVKVIKEIIKNFPEIPFSTIANIFGVHYTTIRNIANHKTWCHISLSKNENYNNVIGNEVKKPPKGINKRLRYQVFARDKNSCQICGRTPKDDNIKLHIDHIIPRAKGGDNSMENLRSACSDCNLGKGSELLE